MKTVLRLKLAAIALAVVIAGVALTHAREEPPAKDINLLQRYPTTLKVRDTDHARPWAFAQDDIFQVSQFKLEVGNALKVEMGTADLGIGHCVDGAVWAVLIPRCEGRLTSLVVSNQEEIANLWLRFHPAEISRLFPPETVTGPGATDLEQELRRIAVWKFLNSWHAGWDALIPGPQDMTVDADTKGGPRRFFMVGPVKKTPEYCSVLADKPVPSTASPAYEPEARKH